MEKDVSNSSNMYQNLSRIVSGPKQLMRSHSIVQYGLRDAFGREDLASIQRFFRSPWFKRRWILQEARVSQTTLVFSGDSLILWIQMSLAVNSLANRFARNDEIDQGTLDVIQLIDCLRVMHCAWIKMRVGSASWICLRSATLVIVQMTEIGYLRLFIVLRT